MVEVSVHRLMMLILHHTLAADSVVAITPVYVFCKLYSSCILTQLSAGSNSLGDLGSVVLTTILFPSQ